jgi:hypothetical protein
MLYQVNIVTSANRILIRADCKNSDDPDFYNNSMVKIYLQNNK